MSKSDATRLLTILVADDDKDDRELIGEALQEAGFARPMKFVVDGNSFIAKPTTFSELVSLMRACGRYWLEIVDLPGATIA